LIQDDRVKKELNRLVELFKTKDLPDICSKAFISNGNKPSAKWSFSNKIIMLANETMDARGFRQWEQVQRYVKKGTHAFYILAPRIVKVKEIDKDTQKETIKEILNGWLGVPVFKYEDTEGKALPEIEPKELPALFDIAQKIGIKVQYSEYDGSRRLGFFSPLEKKIVLYTQETSTFYHELTHAIQEYLEGLQKGNKDTEEYKLNEIIAELTGATIANLYGAKVDNSAYNYIKYYAAMLEQYGTDNDKVYRAIMRVLGKVEKILNFVFSQEVKPAMEVLA
jgi:hypothetical protein